MTRRLKIVVREVLEAGFRQVWKPPEREGVPQVPVVEDASDLAKLKKGDRVKPKWVRVRRQVTQPSKGMSEAALIRALEACSIGRPATYASIIETLIAREYAVRDDRGALTVTDRGRAVCDFLTGRFPEIFDHGFTAQMETWLDDVSAGQSTYEETLGAFWAKLQAALESGDIP